MKVILLMPLLILVSCIDSSLIDIPQSNVSGSDSAAKSVQLKYEVQTIAGNSESYGLTIDGYSSSASFALTFDMTAIGDSLYLIEENLLRRMNLKSGLVSTIAIFDDWPNSVTHFQDNLFIGFDSHIKIFDTKSFTHSIFVGHETETGFNDGIAPYARFDGIYGMVVNENTLYLTDSNNGLVRKVDLTTKKTSTIAGNLSQSGLNIDGVGQDAHFHSPWKILHHKEYLYVSSDVAKSNQSLIRRIHIPTRTVTTIAGHESVSDYGEEHAWAETVRLGSITGMATDGANIYILDSTFYTIREINLHYGTISTISGKKGFSSQTPIDGEKGMNQLTNPYSLTLHQGKLFFSDDNLIRALE